MRSRCCGELFNNHVARINEASTSRRHSIFKYSQALDMNGMSGASITNQIYENINNIERHQNEGGKNAWRRAWQEQASRSSNINRVAGGGNSGREGKKWWRAMLVACWRAEGGANVWRHGCLFLAAACLPQDGGEEHGGRRRKAGGGVKRLSPIA